MPEHKRAGKKAKRTVKWVLAVVALALVGVIAWVVVIPMVTAGSVTTYDAYQVQTGDINTQKSFSATLSVKKSETFASTQESTVRALYVTSGQLVSEGDPLVLLSTGELFTASFDGAVNEIRVAVGSWLWPNFSVVQVSDLEHLQVAMNVDEYDVESLAVGQACTVSVISLGVDFETVIAHINRVSQSSGTVAFYSVTCDLTVPENILPGMQATVTLPDQSVTGVTTVAMAALAFDENGNPYVLLKNSDGTYTQQAVETGLSDGMQVQIVSGLTEGQTVYAVSGTESVDAGFTFTDIYKFLFGEKTVVNDMSSTRGGGGGQPPDGMPEMIGGYPAMPALPDGQPATDGQTVSDGQTATDAQTTTQTTAQPSAATGDAAGGQSSMNTQEVSDNAQ